MRLRGLFVYALEISAAASFAGCGGSQSALVPQATMPSTQQRAGSDSTGYQVLFDFDGKDGAYPSADLTTLNGMLYGSTGSGGKYGNGTVFSMSTSGQEQVLHNFKKSEGVASTADLALFKGALYGAATGAGSCGCGAIFEMTTHGKLRNVYAFQGGSDGKSPNGVIVLNGTFYGATFNGGTGCPNSGPGCGTVFSLTRSGEEQVLYRFQGGTDGRFPVGGLTALHGVLYGVTYAGGAHGYGTVFSVTTSGEEKILHGFGGLRGDGRYPVAGLTAMNGVLYGTTTYGGNKHVGVVFSITTAGQEHVIYAFQGGSDGAYPSADLTVVNGSLYGTTWSGGKHGDGTVFSLTTSGQERILHSFAGGTDGSYPHAGVKYLDGTLYGTTSDVGRSGQCMSGANCGTVFALTP